MNSTDVMLRLFLVWPPFALFLLTTCGEIEIPVTNSSAKPSTTAPPIETETPTASEQFTVENDGGANPLVTIGNVRFRAELASEASSRQKGLSDRDYLEPGTGMLFIFEDRNASPFWMFNMRFPLDFVWISAQCVVVDITHSVPSPSADIPVKDLELYAPQYPAAYNFEINSGEAKQFDLKLGEKVTFSGIPQHIGETCK
ncbi:MAG: DUF192 domain-containing protein [SAR202 cluster bacterium]|nr:DUF192 domain-containing protein [SAR202 cluster bacterium]